MPLTPMGRFMLARSYAIDEGSFRAELWANSYRCTVQALWFRRKRGLLRVHTGQLWDYRTAGDGKPDLVWFRDHFSAARYGAQVEATWDGAALWTPSVVPEADRAQLIGVLDPLLRHMAVEPSRAERPPAGWTGWLELTEPG